MERRKQKKHLITIIMMFLAISAMSFALPQRADAAEPTVKIGGVDISRYNDNEPHAYNSRQPAITGWTAGKFKLSTDKKTLYIEDFKYSGTNVGISSTEDLTIVTSGTNTFSCGNACGIFLGDSDDDRKMLTIGSASEGTLELNSNSDRDYAVDVGSFSMSAGTVNTSADLKCNGNFTVGGGNLDVSGGVYVDDEASISGGKVSVSRVFDVCRCETEGNEDVEYPGDLKATGGTLTVGENIFANDLTISGADVTVETGWVDVANDLFVSKGTLTCRNTSGNGKGVYVINNALISGTGKVIASFSNNESAFFAKTLTMNGGSLEATNKGWTGVQVHTLTVGGGKLTGRSDGYMGIISTEDIVMTAGEINGAGVSGGVNAKNITVSGGTMLGERTSSDQRGDGVTAWGSFKMTGGKMIGKGEAGRAICAALNETQLGPDIWLSEPAGGITSYHKYYDSTQPDFLEEYDESGEKTETATLQKVSSISVITAPTTTYYMGDNFKPNGLVLGLTFEDGSRSTLEYNGPNTYREGVISLDSTDQSLDQPLEPGKHVVEVKCLNCTDTFTINVKDIGPTTLSGTASSDSQTLNWDPVDGVKGYQVYKRKADENDYSLIPTIACTINTTGMQPGETWEYYVVPVRSSNTGSEVCGEKSNVVRLTTDISAPKIRLSGSSYDSACIEWEDVTGAKGYDVYRSDDDGPYNKIAYVTGIKYTDTGLVTGRNYSYYVISAIPKENVFSSPSNTVEVTPGFAGETTLGVKNAGKYVLSWASVEGATSYEIRRGSGSGGERELLTVTEGAVTSFTDESADIYSVYNYTVVPLRSTEEGDFRGTESNTAVTEATPKPAPEIKPPQEEEPDGTAFGLLQARAGKATKRSVQIRWKQVSGAKSYIIYGNKCGKKNKYVKLTTTTSSSLTFKIVAGKKVKKGTYYKFLVYALDGRGNKITASKTIHVATKGGKVGNDKAVKTAAKKSNVTLGKGKTFRLKAKAIPASRKLKVHRHRRIAYESSNNKVASVSPSGVIKAKGSGTCYVYAYAQNGVFKMIRVTVTE